MPQAQAMYVHGNVLGECSYLSSNNQKNCKILDMIVVVFKIKLQKQNTTLWRLDSTWTSLDTLTHTGNYGPKYLQFLLFIVIQDENVLLHARPRSQVPVQAGHR